jgi:hypothetical protein
MEDSSRSASVSTARSTVDEEVPDDTQFTLGDDSLPVDYIADEVLAIDDSAALGAANPGHRPSQQQEDGDELYSHDDGWDDDEGNSVASPSTDEVIAEDASDATAIEIEMHSRSVGTLTPPPAYRPDNVYAEPRPTCDAAVQADESLQRAELGLRELLDALDPASAGPQRRPHQQQQQQPWAEEAGDPHSSRGAAPPAVPPTAAWAGANLAGFMLRTGAAPGHRASVLASFIPQWLLSSTTGGLGTGSCEDLAMGLAASQDLHGRALRSVVALAAAAADAAAADGASASHSTRSNFNSNSNSANHNSNPSNNNTSSNPSNNNISNTTAGPNAFRYTTLEDTRAFIAANRPRVRSMEEALRDIEQRSILL